MKIAIINMSYTYYPEYIPEHFIILPGGIIEGTRLTLCTLLPMIFSINALDIH
tara:strand:+ start:148 stop:306 length:159 start_codon:yes stop_codon:yes gene_type:complete